MNRGIYAVATSMNALVELQSILSNNLVNINTPAFKQEVPVLSSAQETPMALVAGGSLRGIGPLDLGVYGGEHHTDFSQGPLEASDRPLSLAINGDAFFVVETPDGERYTRNGSFSRDAAGYLVTHHGYRVLGEAGPIQLPDGDVTIDRDGTIWSGKTRVARLALVRFADPETLQRAEQGLFGGQNPQPVPAGEVVVYQGFLERANVDVTSALVTMMMALRTYEANQKMLKVQDQTVTRLLDLGRM